MVPFQQRGQYFGLYLETGGSPTGFTLVACLNNKGIKIANKVIDGTSDCGPNYLCGFPDTTVNCKGYENFYDNTVESMNQLRAIAIAQTSQVWIIQPIGTPQTGDYSLGFTGFVSNWQEEFNTDTVIDFTMDIQVQGVITPEIF